MNSNKIKLNSIKLLLILLTIFSFAACSTDSSDSKLSLSFNSGQGLQKNASDSLTLESIKIMLKDIKIKEQSASDTTSLKVGPFVVNLNVNGMTTDFAVGNIPPGTYDRVKFEIHKLNPEEAVPDSEFTNGMLRYAAVIKGTFNSQPFIYKYQNSAKEDLKLATPIQVGNSNIANFTITVDPYSWFLSNGNFLNPNDTANNNVIDENIKRSFKKISLDNNHDGLPD